MRECLNAVNMGMPVRNGLCTPRQGMCVEEET